MTNEKLLNIIGTFWERNQRGKLKKYCGEGGVEKMVDISRVLR